MICVAALELYRVFQPLLTERTPELDEETTGTVYDGIETADFSHLILSAAPRRLGVLCLGDVG